MTQQEIEARATDLEAVKQAAAMATGHPFVPPKIGLGLAAMVRLIESLHASVEALQAGRAEPMAEAGNPGDGGNTPAANDTAG